MKKIRFLSWVLCFCALLCSCSETATVPEPESEIAETASETEAEVKGLNLIADNGQKYLLVRQESCSDAVKSAFVSVKSAILEKTGVSLSLKDDWIGNNETAPECEILFGNTNRPESAEALSKMSEAGFIICVIGEKLVINGSTDKQMELAADYFIKEILPGGIENISRDFLYTQGVTTEIQSITINGVDLREYRIVYASSGNYKNPANTLSKYLVRHCSCSLESVSSVKEAAAHEIVIGNATRDDKKLDTFETAIYMKNGSLYLSAGCEAAAEQVVYSFIAKYLSSAGRVELTFPEDGSVQYSSSAPDWSLKPKFYSNQELILANCYEIEEILEVDMAAGKYYQYANSGYEATITKARSSNNRLTNCVIAVNWAMKNEGFWTSGLLNIKYDGTIGYTMGSAVQTCVDKNFEIIPCTESIGTLIKKGSILPGDIILFQNHMQIIIDDTRAFDGGRNNTEEKAVMSKFVHFIGKNNFSSTRVGFIFRAKDAE